MRLASLKRLLILSLIASSTLGASKCTNGEAPEWTWAPPLFAGDHGTQLVVRGSGSKQERIPTSDPRFSKMMCTWASEFPKARQAYFDVINQCEKWKSAAAAYDAAVLGEFFIEAEAMAQEKEME